MMTFEALGKDCEFGLVQRSCGAEPLGLFRFAGSTIANLTRVIESDLEGFLTSEDVALEVRDTEFMTFSRHYADFHTHTHAHIHTHDEPRILAREAEKADYLRSRFRSDWQDATRIYVHSGCEDEAAILRLHAALRAKSDCVLLWVVKARDPGERGRVQVHAPNLLKGYIAHYATFSGTLRLDLPGWAMVCRAAEAIASGLPETPAGPVRRFEADLRWERRPGGSLEMGSGRGRCRVLRSPGFCVPVVGFKVKPRLDRNDLVVFSLWVCLPKILRVWSILLTSEDASTVNQKCADPTVRGEWQQIWLVMRMTNPEKLIGIDLFTEADVGTQVDFGGWQFEAGSIPDEGLRPVEPTSLAGLASPRHASIVVRTRTIVAKALARASNAMSPDPDPTIVADAEQAAHKLLVEANALMNAGMFDDADTVLMAGMILHPWKAELFTHRALCAEKHGRASEALSRWQEVVRFFPHIAVGHYRLAAILRERGDHVRSLEIIRNALPDHRDDACMVVEAARTFGAAGCWPEAVEQWNAAIALAGEQKEWLGERRFAEKAARIATAPGA